MPNDKMEPIVAAVQEFYEKTGIRITDLSVKWAVGAGCSEVVAVNFHGEQP